MTLSAEDRLLLVEGLGMLWGEGRRRLKALPPGPEAEAYRAQVGEQIGRIEELRERIRLENAEAKA